MKAVILSDSMNRFFRFHFILVLVVLFASSAGVAVSAEKNKAAFLKAYCVKCHNAEKHKGDVRLDQLALRVTGDNHELWKEVIHNLQRGDMPPEDAKQPKANERQAFLAEAIGSLTRYEVDARSLDPPDQ
jgi:cytochrome c551/c552